jgi:Ran-binding protein 1
MADNEDDDAGEVEGNVAAAETGADEAAGDATEFVPKVVVHEVAVTSGEEEEEVCFKGRCKLFLFVVEDVYGGEVRQNYWKERGTGDVKLLKHKEMGKVRLLMRQEKTLKICANHLVSPFVELRANVGSDRSWVFTSADFADEELKTETFAIKFASAQVANQFKDKVELAKKVNAGSLGAEALAALADEHEAPAPESEKAALDKTIEKRNKLEQVRRDSVRVINANEDSEHDSDAEDATDPATEARLKATVADTLAAGIAGVSIINNLPGGFAAAKLDSPEVAAAAAFAVAEINQGKLIRIVQAAQQVVAGMNFSLDLHIAHNDGKTHWHTARVFKPLPHTGAPLKLTEHKHHGSV